jgi:EXPERA (EXPanded EBP superfamily)
MATTDVPFTLDLPTILSLGLVFSFLPIAQLLATYLLPKSTSKTLYWLFIWCVFDLLTHSIVEGSYLYHCFFSFKTLSTDYRRSAALGHGLSGIVQGAFLGHNDRLYGAWYSDGPMARLWQEYAKADKRWGGADVTIISLELLTVFGAGPLAGYVASLIVGAVNEHKDMAYRAGLEAKLWWVATVLSTAELYGGFITFAPEWLSGNTMLEGGDVVYLWLYLVFFNMIWVFIPIWILWASWTEMGSAFVRGASKEQVKKVA